MTDLKIIQRVYELYTDGYTHLTPHYTYKGIPYDPSDEDNIASDVIDQWEWYQGMSQWSYVADPHRALPIHFRSDYRNAEEYLRMCQLAAETFYLFEYMKNTVDYIRLFGDISVPLKI